MIHGDHHSQEKCQIPTVQQQRDTRCRQQDGQAPSQMTEDRRHREDGHGTEELHRHRPKNAIVGSRWIISEEDIEQRELDQPDNVRIWIAAEPVFEYGVRAPTFNEAAAHAAMMQPEYTITIDLGEGTATTRFLTCDLTAEYVRINADYST